jgi:hypothetical protein
VVDKRKAKPRGFRGQWQDTGAVAGVVPEYESSKFLSDEPRTTSFRPPDYQHWNRGLDED